MTRAGAMYLNAKQAAADHRLLARFAREDECPTQAAAADTAADFHARRADQIRSQLHAARVLGLGGSAGNLPKGYFADAPCSAEASQGTARS